MAKTAKQTWNSADRDEREKLAIEAKISLQQFYTWEFLDSWQRRQLCFLIEGCEISEGDRNHKSHEATYCPEDDKIRIYINTHDGRVSRETYNALREAGYKSTPKQNCQFVAVWSVRAENLALALIPESDDIGDEDYSPQERAADRAERFSDYRDKRRDEAHEHADGYSGAPVGNQSAARAERGARRQDRIRDKALTQWEKAEYWQSRTEGVIANALYRSSPAVRRGRILTIEKLIRRIEANYTPQGPERWNEDGREMCFVGLGRGVYTRSVESLDEVREYYARDIEHLTRRREYELQMIGEQGGLASEVEMVVGGFVGKLQIEKINKSPTTGRIVSLGFWGEHPGRRARDGKPLVGVTSVKIERFGADDLDYRDPTPEELAEFKAMRKARTAAAKASEPRKPKLLNLTVESAKQLQQLINETRHKILEDPDSTVEIVEMTQAAYSSRSKGSYCSCKTKGITEKLEVHNPSHYGGSNQSGQETVFKVRMFRDSIVVITDKKQHPVPWELCEEIRASKPQESDVVPRLGELRDAMKGQAFWDGMDDDAKKLFADAKYLGLAYSQSLSQYGLTDRGKELLASGQWSKVEV